MDRIVTARYFHLSSPPTGVQDLPDILLGIARLTDARQRLRRLDGGIVLGLQHCIAEGDFVCGDIYREQTENIPPMSGPAGLTPLALTEGHGIGHPVAFRIHRPTRVILLQQDTRAVSHTRVPLYVAAENPQAIYTLSPILRRDAMERLENRRIREFTVRFASPRNLEALDEAGVAAAEGIRRIAELFQANSLTVKVSIGKSKKKFLDGSMVMQTILGLLPLDGLKTLTAKPEDDPEAINLLKEHLKNTEELDLPERDYNGGYAMRKAFLTRTFSSNMTFLNDMFGPRPDDNPH